MHLGDEGDRRLVGKRENFLSVAVDNRINIRELFIDLGHVFGQASTYIGNRISHLGVDETLGE
jgi:hypothetical protein